MTRGTRSVTGIAIGFGLLLVLSVAVAVYSPALIPTLGIVVVAAALFLDVRATAIVGVVAVVVAAVLLFTFGLDHAWERLANVTLCAVLATAAAWALDRWVRRTAQLQRRESAVLAATPSGLAVVDDAGTVISTNPALTALVPVAGGESLHQALHHLTADGAACSEPDCPLLRPAGVAAGNGFSDAGGRQVPIDWAVTPLDDSRFVVTVTDVTLRVTADEDRRAVALAAEQQADRQSVPAVPDAAVADGLAVDIGGDHADSIAWDVTTLPDGEVLVLGAQADDPATAARHTWKVLYIARAYVAAGVPLADVVRRVSESVSSDGPTPPVRLLALTIDPLTGHVSFVGGDAAPVLVVRGSGTAEWLAADGGLIGSAAAGSRALAVTTVSAADTVVIPSPGALPGRDPGPGAGLAAAAVALRRRELPGLADDVLAGLPEESRGRAGALLLRVAAG